MIEATSSRSFVVIEVEKLGKVGANVALEIARSRRSDLARLLFALGIRHVGEKAAATLARHLRTMAAVMGASDEVLQAIPEIGPVVAASVRAFAGRPENLTLLDRLAKAGVNMTSQAPDSVISPLIMPPQEGIHSMTEKAMPSISPSPS